MSFTANSHPDPSDQASELADAFNNAGVEHSRLKLAPKQVKNADGTWPEPDCIQCGEAIDPKRLEATGTDTCIACANLIEEKGKLYGRR